MHVIIDQDSCIGCGVCSQVCPDVFLLDEMAGISKVIRPEGSEGVQEAVESCPVSCISIEEV